MGTKIIKIKRFPIEKCSNFMAGYTQKEKTENENETKCIQNLLFGLPKSYYKKRPHPLSECGPSLLFRFSLWSNNH